jgi:hypothetical protein
MFMESALLTARLWKVRCYSAEEQALLDEQRRCGLKKADLLLIELVSRCARVQ